MGLGWWGGSQLAAVSATHWDMVPSTDQFQAGPGEWPGWPLDGPGALSRVGRLRLPRLSGFGTELRACFSSGWVRWWVIPTSWRGKGKNKVSSRLLGSLLSRVECSGKIC